MFRKPTLVWIVVGTMVGIQPAQAEYGKETVGDLLSRCETAQAYLRDQPTSSQTPVLDYGWCMGVIYGVMMTTRSLLPPGNKHRSCTANVDVRAAVQAFVNWARDHPELWNYEGLLVKHAALALKGTWPCPDG